MIKNYPDELQVIMNEARELAERAEALGYELLMENHAPVTLDDGKVWSGGLVISAIRNYDSNELATIEKIAAKGGAITKL